MRRPPLPLVLAGLVWLLSMGGCGGSDGPATGSTSVETTVTTTTPAGRTQLEQALVEVAAGPAARAQVAFGDEAALRRLAHAPSSVARLGSVQLDQRWFGLVGFGAPAFVDSAPQLPRVTGIDLYAADRAITLGRPPRSATRLSGRRLRLESIEAALRALGARRATVAAPGGPLPLLSLGGPGALHLHDALGRLGLVSALDRVVLGPVFLVTGAYDEPVIEAMGHLLSDHPPLATVPLYAEAARCLGDPVAALLVPGPAGLLALGVDRPPPHPPQVAETLCAIGTDRQLERAERALRAALPIGGSTPTGALANVRSASLTRTPGTLRAALRLGPDIHAGELFRLQTRGELGRLLSSPSG